MIKRNGGKGRYEKQQKERRVNKNYLRKEKIF